MTGKEKLTSIISDFISTVAIYLPDDVEKRMKELASEETEGMAKDMYDCILNNVALAKKLKRPLCQDTGVLQFFVSVGTKFPYIDDLKDAIVEATAYATKHTPLRPNVVEPLGERNTGDNVGWHAPYIDIDIVPGGDGLELGLYMAGGGCSLPGRSKVLMPLEGVAGIKKFVYDTILEWGVNACPPLIVGIGLGTCVATSAKLSKKAIMRTIGTYNEMEKVATLEKEIQEGLDSLGIAPLGLGGKHSVQAVHIECAGHHPATLGVGITTGCWATRRGVVRINADLTSEIITHKNAKEA